MEKFYLLKKIRFRKISLENKMKSGSPMILIHYVLCGFQEMFKWSISQSWYAMSKRHYMLKSFVITTLKRYQEVSMISIVHWYTVLVGFWIIYFLLSLTLTLWPHYNHNKDPLIKEFVKVNLWKLCIVGSIWHWSLHYE